jgi:choline-sulfatase
MPPPRNIIILQSDQHRGDWLGCAGADFIHSPNLDALATRGVRFSQAYTPYPLCGPARMSFMTGLHPFRNGLHTNDESLPSHTITWAHALGLAGYHTVLCGRIHFSGPDQRHGFNERIFGDFNPSYPGGPGPDMPKELRRACVGNRPAVDTAGTKEEHYFLDYDEHVTRAAEDYIANQAADPEAPPLALCVGFFLPHSPFSAPGKYVERARSRAASMGDPLPPQSEPNVWNQRYLAFQKTGGLRAEDFREVRIQYAAMIDYLDERIGRVLAAADALPGETMVCYFSDHGERVGDHGNVCKGNLGESSIHIPWIWAPLRQSDTPAGFPAGTVIDDPVSTVDLAPTLCDLAEIDQIPDLDGNSLQPYLHGEDCPQLQDRDIFAEVEIFAHLGPARMVRRGNLKYLYYHHDRDALFDLATDPDEQRNLIDKADYQNEVERMREICLREWNPNLLQKECRRAWNRLHYLSRWGREIGRKQWGYMDVWPGKDVAETCPDWMLPQRDAPGPFPTQARQG